jgi:hypothetical protein
MAAEDQPKGKSKWRVVKWAILCFITLAIAAVFGRALSIAMESSGRATCKNHLKKIGLAMHIYASDHDDNFPQGETAVEVFSELIEGEYLADERVGGYDRYPVYVCPSARDDVKAWKRTRKLTEETCSYEFVGGVNADSSPEFIAGFDKSADYHWTRVLGITLSGAKGRNVLFTDTHVEWMREDRFQDEMSWQREMMKRLEEGEELIQFHEWREASKEEEIQ